MYSLLFLTCCGMCAGDWAGAVPEYRYLTGLRAGHHPPLHGQLHRLCPRLPLCYPHPGEYCRFYPHPGE